MAGVMFGATAVTVGIMFAIAPALRRMAGQDAAPTSAAALDESEELFISERVV